MNYDKPTIHINPSQYEYIVSLGNKCPTTMMLRNLNVYHESFPFDYIPTTPALILKYLKDQSEFYPTKGNVKTKDGVWFGHFNVTDKYEDTIVTFKRRWERLLKILSQHKKILFVYTSEADVYNESGNRYRDNFTELCKICDYIKTTYGYDNFKILAIHTNKRYTDTPNIINYTIHVPERYMSDDYSTHIPAVYNLYREKLIQLLRDIFTA